MKRMAAIALVLAATAAGWYWWPRTAKDPSAGELVLYGNIDLRQVQLAFNNSERIVAVLVQEGDRVRRGQVLARLDTSRLEPQFVQAEAQATAQRQVVERLHNGSRPEEIAEARANVDSAKADLTRAKQEMTRMDALLPKRAVSQSDYDAGKAAVDMAAAKLKLDEKALELLVIGPRKEDIAEAEAQLKANQRNRNCCGKNWPTHNSWLRGRALCGRGFSNPARCLRRRNRSSGWQSPIRNGCEPMSPNRIWATIRA